MTSLQEYTFEWLAVERLPLANKFYQEHSIRGKVGRGDECAILRQTDGQIIAAAVLKHKSDFVLLTHVGVIDSRRRCGLATYLMSKMRERFNESTYCFPFSHLEPLYLPLSFQTILTTDAPDAVLQQYQIYRKQGRDILLMRFHSTSANIKS